MNNASPSLEILASASDPSQTQPSASSTDATPASAPSLTPAQGSAPAPSKQFKLVEFLMDNGDPFHVALKMALEVEGCKTDDKKAAALRLKKATATAFLKGEHNPQVKTRKGIADWLKITPELVDSLLPTVSAEVPTDDDVKGALKTLMKKFGDKA